ncbi:hypothetical protein D3C80_2089270 [compost metagenome]
MRERAEAQAMRQRAFGDDPFMGHPGNPGGQSRQPNVIEGEYEHRDPQDPRDTRNLRDPRDL